MSARILPKGIQAAARKQERQAALMRKRIALAVELARGTGIEQAAERASLSIAQASRMASASITRVIVNGIRMDAKGGNTALISGVLGGFLRRHGYDLDEVKAAVRAAGMASDPGDEPEGVEDAPVVIRCVPELT